MRYALRKQNKIASVYSEAYLKEHIISSLDSYFGNTSDERITDDISQEGYVTCTGEDYPLLRINDLTDDNAMLEFAVIGQQYDVLKLSFLGRRKDKLMSKCHYIYDKQAGKVLIPYCWVVVLSNDIRDCTCRNEDLTFAQFERERYNKELEKRNSIIKELQSENKYLHKELKRHVTLLSKKK